MSALGAYLRRQEGGMVAFHCPGCREAHAIRVDGSVHPLWTWDGNVEAPTFAPSILVRSGHYADGNKVECWCTYNAARIAAGEEPSGFACERCHSFVRAGLIEFLSDCSHALAGQTVPMVPFDA